MFGKHLDVSGRKESSINKQKNPLRLSFIWVTLICCLALSVAFFYISYINEKNMQRQRALEKVDLVLNDFEAQLELMEDIAGRIAANHEFQPFYFKASIANEWSMLKAFRQYRFNTSLTEEYFLYYGGDRVYCSTGTSLDITVFLNDRIEKEEERERFRTELYEMKEELERVQNQTKIIPIRNEIYIMVPFRVNEKNQMTNAVLIFCVEENSLEERFQVVSGQIQGNIALYGEDELKYAAGEEVCTGAEKNAVTAVSMDGHYKLCYLPKEQNNTVVGLLGLQIILIIVDVILIFGVANLFAEKAYLPLRRVTEKYRYESKVSGITFSDAYEELEYMLSKMIKSNMEAALQVQQRQKLLKQQILRMLLEGKCSDDVLSYLDMVDIRLPWSYFYVISISFEKETAVTEEFLESVQKELDRICDESDGEGIYTLLHFPKKLINVICNIRSEDEKAELTEIISEVAGSFGYEPMIGIGNTCSSAFKLSASWLESMDEIYNRQNGRTYVYDSDKIQRIFKALEIGNEQEALERLDDFVSEFDGKTVSLLMQQFILSDFLGAFGKLARTYNIEIDKSDMSLMLTSGNGNDFTEAARKMIGDFCEIYRNEGKLAREEKVCEIVEYIDRHFAEQDISMEKVASEMNVTMAAVREAVFKKSGKMYKDYLIYLRVEYAKELLCRDEIQVAEVCRRVGYINVSYFIGLFREATGVTPAKYRNNIRNMQ